MIDKLIGDWSTWMYGLVSGLIAGVVYLVRKINTNEKQIELLKQEITLREEVRLRSEDEIKGHLRELRDDIKSIMHK